MALSTTSVTLPLSVATAITGKAADTSTIAALSPAKPEIFADEKFLVFTGGSEAEVVAEGGQKSAYTQTLTPVVGTKFTVQTTTRVSNQLIYADEDNQLQIVTAIQDDQAKALGRALDYVVYHAIQPRNGSALAGYTALSSTANQVALGAKWSAVTDAQLVAAFDNMADSVNDRYDINGFAMSKILAGKLRRIRVADTMARMYPDIPLNLNVGSFEGVPAAASGTVNGRLSAAATNVYAFMGDFSMIRWGVVRNIAAEIIPYGDPDGAGDLKRLNQVAYRTEATYAYAVVNPDAISVLKATAEA